MPRYATQKMIGNQPRNGNLFLPVPDTDFRSFLDEVVELLRLAPEIITEIDGDLDAHAREKKRLRLEDRKFFESRTEDLPELEIEHTEVSDEDLTLGEGELKGQAQAGLSPAASCSGNDNERNSNRRRKGRQHDEEDGDHSTAPSMFGARGPNQRLLPEEMP